MTNDKNETRKKLFLEVVELAETNGADAVGVDTAPLLAALKNVAEPDRAFGTAMELLVKLEMALPAHRARIRDLSTRLAKEERAGHPGLQVFADSFVRASASTLDPPMPLQLSFKERADPSHWLDAGNMISTMMKSAVLRRDNHCCQVCGFWATKYQEVLARGGATWDMRALSTMCIFCAQILTLEVVETRRSGVLVHAPDISQQDLNALAVSIYIGRISQGPAAEACREVLASIMAGRAGAVATLGYDDPKRLSEDLRACDTAAELAELRLATRDIRLFALDRRIIKEKDMEFNQFPQIVAFWRSKNGPFGGKTPPQWNFFPITTLSRRLASPVRFAPWPGATRSNLKTNA